MIKTLKVDSIEKHNYTGDVYNLELETNERSIVKDDLFWIDASSGIISHNCFPKDLNAFIDFFEEIGVEPTVMKATWKKNLEVRENLDWKDIPGAVSNKD
jgi:UDPglucose 6-dehydrogenase